MASDSTSLQAFAGAEQGLLRVGRVVGSGLLFATFGVGAVILAAVLIPIAVWLRRGAEPSDLIAQRWIQRSFALYVRFGRAIQMWDFDASSLAPLAQGPYLVVANHPSLMDVVFLISGMPQADCVVKSEAWDNPALRLIVRAANYIPNDDGESLVQECIRRLQAGRSVILFPEGSRSPDRGLAAFKRGAAHAALGSGCRILPVAIDCQPPALKKGQAWHAIPLEKPCYAFDIGQPLEAGDLVESGASPAQAARRVTAWLRSYFEARLDHGLA